MSGTLTRTSFDERIKDDAFYLFPSRACVLP